MKYLALLLISLPAFGQFGAASRILSGTGAPVAAQCTVENNVGLVWARKDGADVGTTFYVCGATGVGTYGWELRGGAPGGGSTLTTVGSIPFVTAAGVLGQNTNFRFFNGTGNLVVGTTTDGNFRLDVASSGSSGTTRIYDQTPTTGSTSLVVRAGAGQSSNNLQAWQNAAGSAQVYVASDFGVKSVGTYFAVLNAAGSLNEAVFGVGVQMASGRTLAWSSTTEAAATKDLSLSRASANTLQVGDGSANSNGTILARIHTWSNGTEGTCDATLRGQVVMVQGGAGVADTFRICRKDATDTYLWAPVDNNVALQVVSAGPTATVTNQVRRVYVDPASVIASLTLTLPATPLDADQVQVYFGGTVANRAAVVTTLSIAPNTGHAISQFNSPANAFGGDMVTYEYRAAAARWYRIQ